MKRMLIHLLVVAFLLLSGCQNTPNNTLIQPSTVDSTSKNGNSDLLDIQWTDKAFDFSSWLKIHADYNANLKLYAASMVTTTWDDELQAAVSAIDVSYPLSDCESIEQYVFLLDGVLHNYGYLEDNLVPQMQGLEFGPCWVRCYTDEILEIGYYATGPAAPYLRDATGPKVFVSAIDGQILFIAYFE